MKRCGLSIVTVMLLSTVSGMAGGSLVVEPSADEWSGPYIGVQAGYIWGDADVDYDDGDYSSNGISVDGSSVGVYGGYNWVIGNQWLLGLEGDWNNDSGQGRGKEYFRNGAYDGTSNKVTQKWDASLRLRAGMVMGKVLPYITGGIAWTRVNAQNIWDLWNHETWDSYMTLHGWTVGLGVEMALSKNFHLRLQYRHTDYASRTRDVEIGGTVYKQRVNYDTNRVSVGFSYRF